MKMPVAGIAERPAPVVFYDAGCGLCHWAVRFTLARDKAALFRFAPLGGPAFERLLSAEQRSGLPDSMIVRTPDRRILTQSDAVIEILRPLGGVWGPAAVAAAAVPRGVRNAGYRFAAAVRRRLFARPANACPVAAPTLRARFLFD